MNRLLVNLQEDAAAFNSMQLLVLIMLVTCRLTV